MSEAPASPPGSPPASPWRRQSAWSGILAAGRHGTQAGEPGVVAQPVELGAMAALIGSDAGAQRLHDHFLQEHALTPPRSPAVAAGTACTLVWTGPHQWLALSADPLLPARLATDLGDCAAVVDQTDARAVLNIGGPHWRNALAKGCPVDLHPQAFKPGDAAVTAIAHVGVLLWRLPADEGVHIAAARSMAGSFWSWLSASAAEYGLQVAPADAPAS